jgi:DnaJ-class molecular chaperone
MGKRDYYEILGISKDSSKKILKKHTENLLKNIIQM